jgi:carboxyl-terminal processing protease
MLALNLEAAIARVHGWRVSAAAVVGCAVLMGSCDLRTVSASLENFDRSAYNASFSGGEGLLSLRMPWPELDDEQEFPSFPSEVPPGQPKGEWREQVTMVPSRKWNVSSEYWFSWFLLHLFVVDREHLPDPVALRNKGAESLFVASTRDPRTGVNDRFTHYYPPEIAERVGDALSGTVTYMRFGFFLRAVPSDTPTIGSVVKGSPAELAGLKRDDRVVTVDGVRLDSVLADMDDTKPTSHAFRVYRPSARKEMTISVTTGEVNYPSVWADTLPGGIGYVSITQFVSDDGVETDVLFGRALQEMSAMRRNMDAWILDLRDNGGGTILSSQGVAGFLLGPGQPLVRVQEREVDERMMKGFTKDTILYTPKGGVRNLPSGRILFLQDGGTASASEILLSSLRESIRDRIVTYGGRSYGKGIGQIYYMTPGGAYAAVTCMHIDPIDSARYHGVGISPDVATRSGEELTRAIADIVVAAGRSSMAADRFKGLALADRWNRHERRFASPRPLKPSGVPGALGVW